MCCRKVEDLWLVCCSKHSHRDCADASEQQPRAMGDRGQWCVCGFGSTLLEGAIVSDHAVEARLSFNPDGFVYELDAPLHVTAGAQSP